MLYLPNRSIIFIYFKCIKEKVLNFFPTFEIYKDNTPIGKIKQKPTFFKSKYVCDLKDYQVDGDFWALNYDVKKSGVSVASVNKKFFSLSDTYTIECNSEDAFNILLIVVAIDAINCGRRD